MTTKYFATTCEYMLHEDDWIQGEGKLISRWDEANCMESANTIRGVIEQIPYLDKSHKEVDIIKDFEHDPCYDDEPNRFDADLTVDVDFDKIGSQRIIKPTEEKYALFEKGKVKLYSLHISIYIKKTADLDVDDVCKEGWMS